MKQRYFCTYQGRLGTGTGTVFGNSAADGTFNNLDRAAANSGPFMPPQLDLFPTASFGADIGTLMMPDPTTTFQLNNGNFDSLFAAVPESNDPFLTNTWPSQLPQTSSTVPHDKTLARKDYSKITPVCVCTSTVIPVFCLPPIFSTLFFFFFMLNAQLLCW